MLEKESISKILYQKIDVSKIQREWFKRTANSNEKNQHAEHLVKNAHLTLSVLMQLSDVPDVKQFTFSPTE